MLSSLERIIIVAGHYGAGKTNLAVNLALDYQKRGEAVTLCDLDIVNPYFRSSDFQDLARERGIGMITPTFAGTNLDVPALNARLDAAISGGEGRLIVDVGGDDAGAAALGRYSTELAQQGYSFLYVINRSRPITATPEQAAEILGEIERASRLRATHIVNNTHLAQLTTAETILQSGGYVRQLCKLTGLALLFTTAPRPLAEAVGKEWGEDRIYPIDIHVKAPW